MKDLKVFELCNCKVIIEGRYGTLLKDSMFGPILSFMQCWSFFFFLSKCFFFLSRFCEYGMVKSVPLRIHFLCVCVWAVCVYVEPFLPPFKLSQFDCRR